MARPIVLSNGQLHIGINNFGLVHDFYYPYVGYENHSFGQSTRHRIGVFVDGKLSWLDDPGVWEFKFIYPSKSLTGHSIATNKSLGIDIEIDSFVHSDMNALLRNIHVINNSDKPREVRLFMHQAFAIGDSRSNTDTAQYLPDSDAILHYRGRRAFIISGHNEQLNQPFDQHSIGLFGIEGREGTWRDAEDGELECGNVEHGRVDSTLRFVLTIDANSSERVHYWVTAGKTTREALDVHKKIESTGFSKLYSDTENWWQEWLKPAIKVSKKLPTKYHETFLRSLMIIKSQIDKRGAIMASTDSSMLNYNRDGYSYCWPRDGALVLWPLIRMGYFEEPYNFFKFIVNQMHSGGYVMQKYRADGGLGASWHPYVHGDDVAPPIQEDETALTLFVFSQFFEMTNDKKMLSEFYNTMICPMADWMCEYIDDKTGLPKPSYDLWEEKFLATTYTTAVTYGALLAAAELAEVMNDSDRAVKCRSRADDIAEAAKKHLWNEKKKFFYKGIYNGEKDETVDVSSFFGAYLFGLFDAGSSEIKDSLTTLNKTFIGSGSMLAYPRYEHDQYRRESDRSNWWIITTMWMAQYYLDNEKSELTEIMLEWIHGMMEAQNVLPEQINPANFTMVSPAPLTWSHAEYVSTLLDLIASMEKKR